MSRRSPRVAARLFWLVVISLIISSIQQTAFLAPASAESGKLAVAINPTGVGYWTVDSSGSVVPRAGAPFHGDLRDSHLNQPVVGMAPTTTGAGYWLVASDGGIFAFGDAIFRGSTGHMKLNKPIVGMASTLTGRGYWLIASDGGIFSYGDARFFGSTGAIALNQPIVGMAPTATGAGYWLVASDGGIFAFGDAGFFGSTGAIGLNQPIVGMAATGTGLGYWLVASDGGIFAFGDATFLGSGVGRMSGRTLGLSPSGDGYAVLGDDGTVVSIRGPEKVAPRSPATITPPTGGTAGATLPTTATRYVTPTGAGLKNGSDWANAGTVTQMSAFAGQLPPGGQILLRADMGDYRPTGPISIKTSGGAAGNPIVIRGAAADGTPMPVRFVGNRANPWSPGQNGGTEIFRLLPGANHLRFTNMTFLNAGDGAIRVGGDIVDLTIDTMTATNVKRFFQQSVSGTATSASVTGLVIKNVEVRGYSKSAIHLSYNTNNVLIEDVVGDSERQDGDNFAIGTAIDKTVHDVTLNRVTMANSHDSTNDYWNGDGFTAEADTYDLRFVDTLAYGNTDGGYDIKGSNISMVRANASDNKWNYRFWGQQIQLSECQALNPLYRGGSFSQGQVWAAEDAIVNISGCTFSDNSTGTRVFSVQNTAHVTATNTTVQRNPLALLTIVAPTAVFSLNGVQLY